MMTESQEVLERVKRVIEKKDYHDLIDASMMMSTGTFVRDVNELLAHDRVAEVKALMNDIQTSATDAAVLLSEKAKAENEYLMRFLPYLSQCVKEYHESHKNELKCCCMDCQADILLKAVKYIVETIHTRELLKHAVIVNCGPSSPE